MEKTRRQYDLTEGRILDKLLLVALPIMGTQLMQMAYNLTDMFWLGRISSDAVAASGTAGNYLWLSQGLLFFGRMGAEIGVSQSIGKGDEKTARRYCQNSLLIAIVLGVIFGALITVFSTPLIGFFNIREAHVAKDASDYLFITAMAIPVTYVTAAIAGTFNGYGNSKAPFFINSIGLVINMILDPVLIFNLDMGIIGAAVATVLAQVIVCLLSIVALFWKKLRPFERFRFFAKPDLKMIGQIFHWSTPIAMESLLFTLLSMIISRFVAAFGSDAIAVQRVGSQIESLSWLIGGGFASAITAFVGQNYGAGKWTRIRRGFRIAFIAIFLWGLAVTIPLLFAGAPLFRIFVQEPHIVEMGVVYLRILAMCQVFMTVESAASGAFRGMGKTLPPSLVSVVSNALRVPLAYFLSLTSLGLNGLWLGITLGAMLRGVWTLTWFLLHFRKQPVDDIEMPGADVQAPDQLTMDDA